MTNWKSKNNIFVEMREYKHEKFGCDHLITVSSSINSLDENHEIKLMPLSCVHWIHDEVLNSSRRHVKSKCQVIEYVGS